MITCQSVSLFWKHNKFVKTFAGLITVRGKNKKIKEQRSERLLKGNTSKMPWNLCC